MSERPAKRRRVELSLDDKVKIINKYETLPKPTLQSLSDSFGIGKSTVSNIIKKRDTYKSQYENNANGSKRRFNNACKFDRLNELVWQWFCQARAKNIPVSGPIIQEKASAFAKELSITDFKGSNGWLDRWKARYSIKGFKVSGESAGVDGAVVENYRERIPEIVGDYSPEDVFNIDIESLTQATIVKQRCASRQVTMEHFVKPDC